MDGSMKTVRMADENREIISSILFPVFLRKKADVKVTYHKRINQTTFTIARQDYQKDKLIDVEIIKNEHFVSKDCLQKYSRLNLILLASNVIIFRSNTL